MDMILKNTFQRISPAYELIGDVTVASNTTQVDFTGLNIGKDDELMLVGDWVNGVSSTNYLNLFANSNTTASNYYRQTLVAENETVIAAISALALITQAIAGSKTKFNCNIKLANSGYVLWQSESTRAYGGSSPLCEADYGSSAFTLSSITSITVSANVSNAIGTGSRFQLYKLVAEKVADIIVPSNTTSVDITGLNIGKAGEYYLVSDVRSSTGYCQLFVNGNETATNYYDQALYANSTTIGAVRHNASYMNINPTNHLIMSNLKLTNSGYFVAQHSVADAYGGSSFNIKKIYTTSTFTLSSATSLKLTASATNAIGANSRFTLYKMK